MSDKNCLPIAMSDADHNDPAIMLNLANILCGVFGYPESDEARAKASQRFTLSKREDVVGNPDEDVPAGSTWWISADYGTNLLGDNIAQAQAKLDEAKLKKMGDTKFGEITEEPELWFRHWGIYSEPEVI